jgi:hypothetical protein
MEVLISGSIVGLISGGSIRRGVFKHINGLLDLFNRLASCIFESWGYKALLAFNLALDA